MNDNRLPTPGTGLPGRNAGGAARRRRCRRRRGLLRPAERDQRAQFSRTEFHAARSSNRSPMRMPQGQAAARGQYLSAGRQVRHCGATPSTAPHELGVDAVIVADMGVADYAARNYPDLRLHLSVQAGASSPEAIRFLLRAVRHQARGAAAHAHRRRNRRAASPDPVRDRSLHLRQYRHDGGGPLQPEQLRDRRVHQHGRRLLAGGRRALRGGRRAQSDDAARRIRDRLLRRRRKRRLSDHLQGPLSVRRQERRLLRLRGAGQPQSVGAVARPDARRRHRAQDRGPPAQPRLREVGRRRLSARRSTTSWPAARPPSPACWRSPKAAARPKAPSPASDGDSGAGEASELTLGPVLFNWEPERWRDFYFRIADEAPVDGRLSRRGGLLQARAAVRRRISTQSPSGWRRAGKTVVRSDARRGDVEAGAPAGASDVCADRDRHGGGQ